MKILKIVALLVGVIIVIPLVFAVFIDSRYAVEREIIINRPNTEVFEFVRHLKNQDHYSKWVRMDPEMKKDFKGEDGSVGCIYFWDGDKAGKGEQKIIAIKENERIDAELHFIKPLEGIAHTKMTTEQVSGDQTRVTWGMEGENKYPMNFMNLFMSSMLGTDLDESLQTLKSVLEKRHAAGNN
jgi:hypothetical protein